METKVDGPRILTIDDHEAFRTTLVDWLTTSIPGAVVLGAASAEEGLAIARDERPDVVLMDIKLPGLSGVTQLKRSLPSLQILMLTVYEDSERLFRALKAGADGYLVKSSPPEGLLAAIDDVRRGGSPMSSHIARKVVRHFHHVGPSPEESENLSPRELEVLNRLSSGSIYKEISDQRGLGIETMRTYVKNIGEKMHVRNRVEAVAQHGGEAT